LKGRDCLGVSLKYRGERLLSFAILLEETNVEDFFDIPRFGRIKTETNKDETIKLAIEQLEP